MRSREEKLQQESARKTCVCLCTWKSKCCTFSMEKQKFLSEPQEGIAVQCWLWETPKPVELCIQSMVLWAPRTTIPGQGGCSWKKGCSVQAASFPITVTPKSPDHSGRVSEAMRWVTTKPTGWREAFQKRKFSPFLIGKLQRSYCLISRAEVFVCLNELNGSSCTRTKFTTAVPGTPPFSAKIKSLGH